MNRTARLDALAAPEARPRMSMTIEKGVPIPDGARGRLTKLFAAMDVGDSFFTTNEGVGASSSAYGKKHGKRFCSRRVDGGMRVWRIE